MNEKRQTVELELEAGPGCLGPTKGDCGICAERGMLAVRETRGVPACCRQSVRVGTPAKKGRLEGDGDVHAGWV